MVTEKADGKRIVLQLIVKCQTEKRCDPSNVGTDKMPQESKKRRQSETESRLVCMNKEEGNKAKGKTIGKRSKWNGLEKMDMSSTLARDKKVVHLCGREHGRWRLVFQVGTTFSFIITKMTEPSTLQ